MGRKCEESGRKVGRTWEERGEKVRRKKWEEIGKSESGKKVGRVENCKY